MNQFPLVSLNKILRRVERRVRVEDDQKYDMMGVRSFSAGCFDAGTKNGNETKYRFLLKVEANDFVYPKLMAWEGAFGLVSEELSDKHVSPEFCTFVVRTSVAETSYIQQLFRWPQTWASIAGASPGINVRRRRLYPDDFLSKEIPLPNLVEQQRIAARLDHLHERRLVTVMKAKGAKTIVAALRDSMCRAESPVERVGDVLELAREPLDLDPMALYRCIGIRSFGNGMICYAPAKGEELSKLRYFRLPPDALLLSNIKAWEGGITVSPENETEFVASNRFLSYTPKDKTQVDVGYLKYFFLSVRGLPLIQRASPGAADRNRTLGIKAFEDIRIPLPPIDEQRRIASLLDRAYEVLRCIEAREKAFDALLKSALDHAFNGLV